MPKVFISRAISEESFFRKKLESSGFEIFGISLLEFSAVPFNELPEMDWIFFYSKNGVQFFFENILKKKITISSNIQFAGFGEATAAEIKRHVGSCDFVGTGVAATTAPLFLKKAKGKKVLFPRAETSRRSVQQLIENEAVILDLVVYKNFPKEKIELPEAEYLIFTSPLNAKAFFQKKPLQGNQKVFAIGKTTAEALQNLGIEKVIIAKKTTEENLVSMLLENI